ncbi:Uncharacterised protein [Mycolicibacterium aurum]|uniref:Uncharacterized protein n=1 Tax=Mycolicibacterium aurum TaxID=1791 RepID=A0A448J054_MYCAU|nr:hypothetical protein [Mycolicibacterium aurum]VEG58153.1 Uncharacterised protein [Mycolicibacterium aurum]
MSYHSEDHEVVSVAEAAAELGLSLNEFIALLVRDGMLVEHPDGGYVPSPHPDITEL